jgi:asparagine synthase (glutamine-hydrolysing)
MGEDVGEVGGYTRSSFERYSGNDYVNQRMFVDAHGYLPDQILALTDRMSMAVSLEARAPFLDYRLMEFVTSLPGEWKVDGREWKVILKSALRDLVPQRTIERPKWGFAPPVRTWMSDKQLDSFVHLLRNSRLARDGYLDGGELNRQMADSGAFQNKGEWLWALSVLELWYRVYEPGGAMARPDATLEEFAYAD